MAASSAGVFWRAARLGELAYGHTRTHFLEGGRGGRLISPAGPREGGRGGGTTSLKGGYGPPGWQKNPTQRIILRRANPSKHSIHAVQMAACTAEAPG